MEEIWCCWDAQIFLSCGLSAVLRLCREGLGEQSDGLSLSLMLPWAVIRCGQRLLGAGQGAAGDVMALGHRQPSCSQGS